MLVHRLRHHGGGGVCGVCLGSDWGSRSALGCRLGHEVAALAVAADGRSVARLVAAFVLTSEVAAALDAAAGCAEVSNGGGRVVAAVTAERPVAGAPAVYRARNLFRHACLAAADPNECGAHARLRGRPSRYSAALAC